MTINRVTPSPVQPTITQLKHYRNLSHARKFLVVANEQQKVAVTGFLAIKRSLVEDRTATSCQFLTTGTFKVPSQKKHWRSGHVYIFDSGKTLNRHCRLISAIRLISLLAS